MRVKNSWGGVNMKSIPFSVPDISEDDIAEVVDTLRGGWITTGPKTKLFEQQIAQYCHTTKAVCLSSATAGLEMTLRVLGIGEGDEVITSAYTYTASASVIKHVGAKIVLVDTEIESYQMDKQQLAQAITEKTKAIIGVDIAGIIENYNVIKEIVEARKAVFSPKNKIQQAIGRVVIIADAAHSFGAIQNGKRSGEIADFTSFSFHAVKNLTTAEGGAITWRDIEDISNEEIYKEYMLLSLHGQSKDALSKTKLGSWEYDILETAYKCNMTDIMASLGISQLKRYEEILHRRAEIVRIYNNLLKEYDIEILAHEGENYSSSYHLYLSRMLGKTEQQRNNIIQKMAEKGIAANVHYKPLPLLTAYKNLGFKIEDYPNAWERYQNEITLPLYTRLTNEETNYISNSLIEILRAY